MKAVPPLSISTEKVCFVIIKSRAFAAKDVVTEPDRDLDAADDGMIEVLEDDTGDASAQEVSEFVAAMTEDEQADLVALAWLGRGDGTWEEWASLRSEALRSLNGHTAEYLLGMPLASDYLEEALSLFGRSCGDEETNRP